MLTKLILISNMLIMLIATNIMVYALLYNKNYLDNSINLNNQYKILLIGIEKYNEFASDLMYTIDAIYELHNILVEPSNELDDTIYVDNYAYPAMFWTVDIGGINMINNYDYVVFAGHGLPYRIYFGMVNTTLQGATLNSAWFYEYSNEAMIYSTRVNWFILLSCSALNLSRDEFYILSLRVFQDNGDPSNTYLHGIVGAASILFDRWYEYDNGYAGADGVGVKDTIIPVIKNTAERFSQYIADGHSAVDAWFNAVIETQRVEIGGLEFVAVPAAIYVYLEVTYMDPFSHTTYNVIYNYSSEGFPEYG